MGSHKKKRIGPRGVHAIVLHLCIAHQTVASVLEVERYASKMNVCPDSTLVSLGEV